MTPNIGDVAGAYFTEVLDVRWTILRGSASGIALQRRNQSPKALVARDATNTRFSLPGTPAAVRFEREAVGRVTGFALDAVDTTDIRIAKLT